MAWGRNLWLEERSLLLMAVTEEEVVEEPNGQ
jgi:hypothetical protein